VALPWFDANCLLGPESAAPPETRLGLEETLRLLHEVGVSRALVTSGVARDYDPLEGNARLLREISGSDGLVPCLVVLPPHSGEFPGGDDLLRYLDDARAGAVRIYPGPHNYGLGARWTDDLFGPLAEAGFPVFMDATEASWPEIDGVLTRHPKLHLVVCRPNYRQIRWAAPLFEAHQGLHVETSLWLAHGGIEYAVERFGHERLLFGSGLPHYAPGGAMSPITYARISEEARRAISGENLAALLHAGGAR
jgi:predicted TIM-barrel fold metal-dependent hydrolase